MSKHLLHLLHILDVHHTFYDELDILPVVDLHLDCPFEDAVVTGDGYLADVDAQLIGKHIGNVVQHSAAVDTPYLYCRIEEEPAVHIPLGIQNARTVARLQF